VGVARGGHHSHCGFIGLHYSIAPRGQRIESSTIPHCWDWHGCRWGAGPSSVPPISRGTLTKPFCTGSWTRALQQPLHTDVSGFSLEEKIAVQEV